MIMQGNTKDKVVVKWYVEMHLYLTLQLLALNYCVKVVGYYYPFMLN
jgi:hypothetical protein